MGGGGAERWCVVTGGRGFAARHLVEMLLRSDDWCVRVADLAPSISLEAHEEAGVLGRALRSGRAAYVSADLRNKAQVVKAFEGIEVVFHMAAPDSSINNYQLHFSVNVDGTRNVIDACIECQVKRLIYTSSPSVVFDGVHGIFNGEESLPYPEKFNDSYSETKAEGEKLILKANGRNGLLTCCIRPSSIFGPGDRLLVPSLVAAAKAGKSKAYFITNGEPIKFWEFMSLILEGLGYERPNIKLPVSFMMPIAHLVEWTYKIFSQYGMPVPQLTPSRIRLLSCNRTFSCSKAKDHIDYEPIVSLKDGIQRTIESCSHLKAEQKKRTSKVYTYLGGGKVADTLLWKDKKQSFTMLLLFVALYNYFFANGYTMITAVAKLVSVVALFLFIHGALPSKILGYNIQKLSPSYFELSEEQARRHAHSATHIWNNGIVILRSLCKGKDWALMFKVVFLLLFLNVLGYMSPQTIYKLGLAIAFFGLYVYDRWEDEIDKHIKDAYSHVRKLTSKVPRGP
ncbi:hypothetical protein ZIOFF_066495 [Zingiber officinale]|uniref:Reticulon-like protein n=1 Tax=Zingiber officinale TaxID=94328 RepID=A0A8J5KDW7_ZINOF|nr:hypothetical protein ZIOFF_066495 [Zingiber officinale]